MRHETKIDFVAAGRNRVFNDHAIGQLVAELDEFSGRAGFELLRRVWNDCLAPLPIRRARPAIGFEIKRSQLAAGKVAADGEEVFVPGDCQTGWLSGHSGGAEHSAYQGC